MIIGVRRATQRGNAVDESEQAEHPGMDLRNGEKKS